MLCVVITLILGLTSASVAVQEWRDPSSEPSSFLIWILAAIAVVCLFASVMMLLSRLDDRSRAVLRLDWFLPQIRRRKSGESLQQRFLGRFMRNRLPSGLVSNHETKRRGSLRRLFRGLGISWLASPPRRIVQAVCLITFLFLFFYVCWPYTARPLPPPENSTGWLVGDVDQATGEFVIQQASDSPVREWLGSSETLFLSRADASVGGAVHVVSVADREVVVVPAEQTSDELLDALLIGDGKWSFSERDPNQWPAHYSDDLARKEFLSADLFLIIDPLVSLSTAIASRSWVWSLASAAVILILCVMVPRGFCGYVCPLGTTIDLFDWAIGSRTKRLRVSGEGWWVHIKYYLLAATLIAAVGGVLVSGFVSAIPVITRALLFLGEPLQSGMLRGWHLIPAMNLGHAVSIAMFFAVLGLGLMRPRFWCKYVCPSGALFSIGNLFRVTERKVESSCINCNKCVEICPFDAIKPDFTTRETDCTMCQSCGGVCPTHAIKFVERWNVVELKVENDPPTGETALGRRGFMSLVTGSAAAVAGGLGTAGAVSVFGAKLNDPDAAVPVRPPGSVPEQEFLQMCIRCGECFKACPNNVLQPEAFEQGLEGLLTPRVEANWAGCESSCNACGQVCPTGAIRSLPLAEKRVARMGLAIVNQQTCLPIAGREDCDLCVQECNAAGYHAIEYLQVGTQVDDEGNPIEGSGRLAPVVLKDKCVGCGLCQTRCYGINVKERGVLSDSAIIVEAGPGNEDRMKTGSYRALRQAESESNPEVVAPQPDPDPPASVDQANPFGL